MSQRFYQSMTEAHPWRPILLIRRTINSVAWSTVNVMMVTFVVSTRFVSHVRGLDVERRIVSDVTMMVVNFGVNRKVNVSLQDQILLIVPSFKWDETVGTSEPLYLLVMVLDDMVLYPRTYHPSFCFFFVSKRRWTIHKYRTHSVTLTHTHTHTHLYIRKQSHK